MWFLAPVGSSSDEFWVLDIPDLAKFVPKAKREICDSFSQCYDMKFGRFSANGQNKELENLLDKREEKKAMAQLEKMVTDASLTEEEMLDAYLHLARKSAKNEGKKAPQKVSQERESNAVEHENDMNVGDGLNDEPVESLRHKPKKSVLGLGLVKGAGVMKKKSKHFTGLGRKKLAAGRHANSDSSALASRAGGNKSKSRSSVE